MIRQPCPRCNTLVARKSFCPKCGAGVGVKASATKRGYGKEWQHLSRMAIALHPWCAICESTSDLTADHLTPLAGGGTRTPTLSEVQVLCRSCNSRKGKRGT